jgi:hypothetical protein
MKNDLNNLGKSLGKDAKESGFNTRRIAANLPQIERKLDILSNSYNFTMDIPLVDVSNTASLNIYIRPDNCCDCDSGSLNGFRKGTGTVTRFEDIDGNAFLPDQPTDSPYNGVDYRGVVTSFSTVGVLDSIWFAWPGYPFFYPNGTYEEDYNNNAYGDFTLTSEGTILIPTAGLYNITYNGISSGITTDTSKIILTIKTRVYGSDDPWEVISKEVRYTIYSSLEPNSLMIAHELEIYAICYGLPRNSEISIWVNSQNIDRVGYSEGTIQILLVGEGYGLVTGYVFHDSPASNPIWGASVSIILPGMSPVLTDETGKYTITRVPPGIHTIQATYSTNPVLSQSQKVTVEANKATTNINFIL